MAQYLHGLFWSLSASTCSPAITGSQTPSVEDTRRMKTAPMRSFWAKLRSVHPSSAPAPQGSADGDGAAAPGPATLFTRDICMQHNTFISTALEVFVTLLLDTRSDTLDMIRSQLGIKSGVFFFMSGLYECSA